MNRFFVVRSRQLGVGMDGNCQSERLRSRHRRALVYRFLGHCATLVCGIDQRLSSDYFTGNDQYRSAIRFVSTDDALLRGCALRALLRVVATRTRTTDDESLARVCPLT